jgi:hypothetical protein
MKGDYSRLTFDAKKPYTGVRLQQGRVLLDSDWNEQVDINRYLRETALTDLVGRCGVPASDPDSFKVFIESGKVKVRGGRIWVGGVLCEGKEREVGSTPGPGKHLVFVDVYQRHVTSVEDPSILEEALGGPDTAARTKTVCRARIQPADGQTCEEINADWKPAGDTDGAMKAQAIPAPTTTNVCEVPSSAGYTGLENHLYRVEIHRGGDTAAGNKPTFKWSRDNGANLARWTGRAGRELSVASLGRDGSTGFHGAKWIELGDDALEEADAPGLLMELETVTQGSDKGGVLTVMPAYEGVVYDPDLLKHPKIRRWESGPKEITSGQWNTLEKNIKVSFDAGTYRSGDYWLIPARAFIGECQGSISWPSNGGGPAAEPPHGVERKYCCLAIVNVGTAGVTVEDCRHCFAPLATIRLEKLTGDGQEGLPGATLPCKLRVRAMTGDCPLAQALVRFKIPDNRGRLKSGTRVGTSVEVRTDPQGEASCEWQLSGSASAGECFEVHAEMSRPGATTLGEPVVFTATARFASRVVYEPDASRCPDLAQASTVQEALDLLCEAHTINAIHIEKVVRLGDNGPLFNDTVQSISDILDGFRIVCDRDVDGTLLGLPPRAIAAGRPILSFTIEVPLDTSSRSGFFPAPGTAPPPTYLQMRLAGVLSARANHIEWQPATATRQWLQALKDWLAKAGGPLLAEVHLRGNFIFEPGSVRRAGAYLDGESFGVLGSNAQRMGLDIEGNNRSGNGAAGGDFRMWFWLGEVGGGPISINFDLRLQGRVAGTVVDDQGGPVKGAKVTLKILRRSQTAVSDPNGRFEFSPVLPGTYVLALADPDGNPVDERFTVTVGPGFRRPPIGVPVRTLSGIGPVGAGRLEEAGIANIEKLAGESPSRVAKLLKISRPRAEKILREARRKAK